MGDFNYPKINWSTLDSDSDPPSTAVSDLILDIYLYQHVREPTRENNILELDLIISSNESIVSDIKI